MRKLLLTNIALIKQGHVAKSPAPERAPIARAVMCIALVISSAATGIMTLSKRANKDVFFQGSCKGVRLSPGVDIGLRSVVTSAHLTNFYGVIEHIDEIQIPTGRPVASLQKIRLDLARSDGDPTGAPASLRLMRIGLRTPMTLKCESSLFIRTAPEQGDHDQIELAVGAGSTFAMQAERYQVEASRYKLNGWPDGAGTPVPDSFKFTASSRSALVQAVLEASSENVDDSTVSLLYPSEEGPLSLVSPVHPVVQLNVASVSLSDCSSAFVQVQNSSDTAIREGSTDLSIETDHFKLAKLFISARNQQGTRFVVLSGSGKSSSVLLDQRQLIPSVLADVLSRPPYEVGLIGSAIVFCVFAGGVFLKRSLDVVAKRVLPD